MSYYRLSLPSRIVHAGQLRRWVTALSRLEGYGERFTSDVELGVHEGFVNAATHGNGGEAGLPVVILFEAGGTGWRRVLDVRIRDFGKGFEPGDYLLAARSEAGLSRPGGRGLLLMSHSANRLTVELLPDGCVMHMRYIEGSSKKCHESPDL